MLLRLFHHPHVLHNLHHLTIRPLPLQLQVSISSRSCHLHQTRPHGPHQERPPQNCPQSNQVLHSLPTHHHVMRLQVLQSAPSARYRNLYQPVPDLPDHQEHLLLLLDSRETDVVY